MATRTVTSTIKRSDGSAWKGAVVRFRLANNSYRASPAETYPEGDITATADANGAISVTLISGDGIVYDVTTPDRETFQIAVPDGSSTTLEGLRAAYSGAPAAVDTVENALIALGWSTNPTSQYVDVAGDTMTGNLTVEKSSPIVTVKATSGTNPEVKLYDTTDGGATIFTDNGVINIGRLTSAGSWSENLISIATNDVVKITDLAGTGVRAVSASATGELDDVTPLTALSDVDITSAASGQNVRYDGSGWVNEYGPGYAVGVIERASMGDSPSTLTNLAAAATEVGVIRTRRKLDLTNARQVRLTAHTDTVAGSTGSDLYLRYSTNNGGAWTDITNATVTIDAASTWTDSGWVDLPSGAKAFVMIALWSKDGDGVADPTINYAGYQIR